MFGTAKMYQKRKNALVELWYTSSQRLFPYPNPILKQKETQTRKSIISANLNEIAYRPIPVSPSPPFPIPTTAPPRLPFAFSTLRSQSESIFVHTVAHTSIRCCIDDYIFYGLFGRGSRWGVRRGLRRWGCRLLIGRGYRVLRGRGGLRS